MTDTLPKTGKIFELRRRAYKAYRWNDRFQWLSSLFKTPAEVGFATASAAVVGTVTGMTVLDAVETRANREVQPIVAERARTTEKLHDDRNRRYDKAGRRGVFEVVVLNKDFMWVHASADELERQGKKIPRERDRRYRA